ncbi:GNAT family N-acetyltransferase [Marinobacter hydrocarbonoclasticus]|nr:GNAT family N-acetyltransferase [Marinobacter nauticus]
MPLTTLLNGQTLPLKGEFHVRLMQDADLPVCCTMLNDPQVNQHLYFAPASDDVYRDYIGPLLRSDAQRQAPVLAIVNAEQAFVGMAALVKGSESGVFELGYQLSAAAWGHGLATAASRLLLSIAFDEFGATEVKADCYDTNKASKRVLEKAGLGRTIKEYGYFENGTIDRCWFAISEAQYRRSQRVAGTVIEKPAVAA